MTPVTQTLFGNPRGKIRGNCLQAAVASILDKSLDEVPHFVAYEESWFMSLIMFMRDHGYEYHGMGAADEITDTEKTKGIDGYVIAAGQSPRGFSHAVVYKDGQLVHDPHPSRAGVELTHFYMFEPFGDVREPLNWIIR